VQMDEYTIPCCRRSDDHASRSFVQLAALVWAHADHGRDRQHDVPRATDQVGAGGGRAGYPVLGDNAPFHSLREAITGAAVPFALHLGALSRGKRSLFPDGSEPEARLVLIPPPAPCRRYRRGFRPVRSVRQACKCVALHTPWPDTHSYCVQRMASGHVSL